jgi:hypothetical protein
MLATAKLALQCRLPGSVRPCNNSLQNFKPGTKDRRNIFFLHKTITTLLRASANTLSLQAQYQGSMLTHIRHGGPVLRASSMGVGIYTEGRCAVVRHKWKQGCNTGEHMRHAQTGSLSAQKQHRRCPAAECGPRPFKTGSSAQHQNWLEQPAGWLAVLAA